MAGLPPGYPEYHNCVSSGATLGSVYKIIKDSKVVLDFGELKKPVNNITLPRDDC